MTLDLDLREFGTGLKTLAGIHLDYPTRALWVTSSLFQLIRISLKDKIIECDDANERKKVTLICDSHYEQARR
jgi:hypothetical protein